MKTIFLEKNSNGKVELTPDEIRKMLDDAYNEGFKDGKQEQFVPITYPSYPYTGYPTWISDHITVTCETPKVTLNL